MKKFIILVMLFSIIQPVFAGERSYFVGTNKKYYCDDHTSDGGYRICTQNQFKNDTLVEAGFNGPRFMEIVTGKTKRKVCIANAKQVNIQLCAWQR